MDRMSSNESSYDSVEKHCLLHVARDSILCGLEVGHALAINARKYSSALQKPRATFVTLEWGGELRGCVGTFEATSSLVENVAYNAYAAAFSDPRFTPLRAPELAGLSLHIAVLNPPEMMRADSEADLLRQLRPGIDGLIIEEDQCRGTFLPSVWETLPNPRHFLRNLKIKAGLSKNYWSDKIKVQRYTAELIE